MPEDENTDATGSFHDAIALTDTDRDDRDDDYSSLLSFATPSSLSMASTGSLDTTRFTLSSKSLLSNATSTEVITKEYLPADQSASLSRTQTLRQRQLQRVQQEIAGYTDRPQARKEHVRVPRDAALPVQLDSADEKLEEFVTTEEEEVAEFMGPSSQLRVVDEQHDNYVLMYDMLTGIRTAVSRCQAKPPRPLTELDYRAYQKLAFDLTGSEFTPQSRYDFKFKDYAPWVFRSIREGCGIDTADYLVSLTGKYVLSEVYSPGKSGSLFYYSQDYRFIIKTIRPSEHTFLLKILPHYHAHLQANPSSLLVRFYGLHRVQVAGRRGKIYFVVMGNIFPPDRPLRSIYDLKGSTHGRINKDTVSAGGTATIHSVLKDLNWLERRERLILGPLKATELMRQLHDDCLFLTRLKIMDYSLLIGLHELNADSTDNTPNESNNPFTADFGGFQASYANNQPAPEVYYLGIIDILTPYSLYKRLETTFKGLVLPRDAISAVGPSVYAKRFLRFMNGNILRDVNSDYSQRPLPPINPEDP